MSIFEQASRLKIRVASSKGDLTVEDLWDLPLESARGVSLDAVGTALQQKLNSQPQSLIGSKTESTTRDTLALDIIKHIIVTKQGENAAARGAAEQRALQQRAKEVLAKRADAALEGLSDDELKKLAGG